MVSPSANSVSRCEDAHSDLSGTCVSRQLDFSATFHSEFLPSELEPAHLLLFVLRAGSVSLRVYRADDRLVRSLFS